MVVFTCNHCGDSLQKPKVEKHYQTKCRYAKSLTCCDCLKDFKGEDYDQHIKCVSEEERYAAKGSIPSGIVKKGEVKQESWVEMIRDIINDDQINLKPQQKRLLNEISTFNNVPRKKNKFINFIKNSTGGRINMNDIEAVWDVIESYKKAKTVQKSDLVAGENGNKQDASEEKGPDLNSQEGENVAAKDSKKKNKKINNDDKEAAISTVDSSNDNAVINKKKSKKRKTTLEVDVESSPPEEIEKPAKKVKKNKSKNMENLNGEDITKPTDVESIDVKSNGPNQELPKKKNKKRKHIDEDIKQTDEICCGEIIPSNKIKNDSNQLDGKNLENGDLHKLGNEINTDLPTKKKNKKRKHIDEDIKQTDEIRCGEIIPSNKIQNNSNQLDGKSLKNGDIHKLDNEIKTDLPTSEKMKPKKQKKKANLIDPPANEKTLIAKEPAILYPFKIKILEILQQQNSMSRKKLQKKVLKAYVKETGESATDERVIIKYNRKLRKIKKVEIGEDTVKLINVC